MKKLGHFRYSNLFLAHVEEFLKRILSTEKLKGQHLISVSGGVDSMTLLWLAKQLRDLKKIGPIRVIFFHHQTRATQDLDQVLVEDTCQKWNVPFTALRLEGLSKDQANFEARARALRKETLLREVAKNEYIWEAHHLNDSYEWHLMQKSKTHYLKSTLGVPVKNQKTIRPFMCVSKNQIQKLSHFENIPFLTDPTNKDIKFERNYVRNIIVPQISHRYPHYLKSYVSQMNSLAQVLKINLISKSEDEILKFDQAHFFLGKEFSKSKIVTSIHHFSSKKRGEISLTADKMLKAIVKNKRGPFDFSGGVKAYFSPGVLMITSLKFKNLDQEITAILESLSREQIMAIEKKSLPELKQSWFKLLQQTDAPLFFPMLCLVFENNFVQKSLNLSVSDSLFPRLSHLCQVRGWRIIPMKKLIETWESKEKRLPKSIGIYPLHELYHLFSSQE